MNKTRQPYPSDVSDDEWEFVLPYLALMRADAPQLQYPLRELFNALRYVVKTGCPWHFLPHDFPPWTAVSQQVHCWVDAGVFEQITNDLRLLLRLAQGHGGAPSAVVQDRRTMPPTPERVSRTNYDAHKKTKGSKLQTAGDTLGHLLAIQVTAANQLDRQQVTALAEQVQQATGESVKLAYVNHEFTGQSAADQATDHGISLEVVKHSEAKRGFLLLPHR